MPISRREEANALIAGCLYNTAALTALRERGRISEDELKALLIECCSNLEWLLRWRDEHPEEYGVVLRKAAQDAHRGWDKRKQTGSIARFLRRLHIGRGWIIKKAEGKTPGEA